MWYKDYSLKQNKLYNNMENGNGECVKGTTTLPKKKKQIHLQHPKATKGSSTQLENPAPGGGLQLVHKQKCVLVQQLMSH